MVDDDRDLIVVRLDIGGLRAISSESEMAEQPLKHMLDEGYFREPSLNLINCPLCVFTVQPSLMVCHVNQIQLLWLNPELMLKELCCIDCKTSTNRVHFD